MARTPQFLLAILLWVLCLDAHSKDASHTAKQLNLLDTIAIHRIYLEGDFDEAIDKIEIALKQGGPYSHADSVFIFKHLGVMYTAKYETREKGKQFMMRLLQAEPTARIMDMYASDMIYMIFKNIQDEFEMSQAKLARANQQLNGGRGTAIIDSAVAGGKGLNGETPKGEKRMEGGGKAWMGWTTGALAAVGGIALILHITEEEAKAARKENVLP